MNAELTHEQWLRVDDRHRRNIADLAWLEQLRWRLLMRTRKHWSKIQRVLAGAWNQGIRYADWEHLRYMIHKTEDLPQWKPMVGDVVSSEFTVFMGLRDESAVLENADLGAELHRRFDIHVERTGTVMRGVSQALDEAIKKKIGSRQHHQGIVIRLFINDRVYFYHTVYTHLGLEIQRVAWPEQEMETIEVKVTRKRG
jgi:hypothetical protein